MGNLISDKALITDKLVTLGDDAIELPVSEATHATAGFFFLFFFLLASQ